MPISKPESGQWGLKENDITTNTIRRILSIHVFSNDCSAIVIPNKTDETQQIT